MPPPAVPPPPELALSAAPRSVGPLGRIVALRTVAAAALAFALLGAVLAIVFSQQQQRAAAELLAGTESHYQARTAQIDAEWLRQADLLRAQIDAAGLLDGDDTRLASARLTAFLSSMGGQGSFTHVLLIAPDGAVLFRYATRTAAVLHPQGPQAMAWAFSPQDRLVYRSLRRTLRLGSQGPVDLLLFAPLDNALLAANAYPNTRTRLEWQDLGAVARSDAGGGSTAEAGSDWLRVQGQVRWGGEAGAPMLHVERAIKVVLPLGELLALVLLGGLVHALLFWLVLGRWASQQVRRLYVLAGSMARFAQGRRLTASLDADLNGVAHGASDEVHTLGTGLKTLMQSVHEAEAAQHQAQDRLRELNATLEQRVEARTQELVQARDAALAASRAREQFLAAMSHELRTPLAGLLGGLELVQVDRLPEAERLMINMARRSGDALRSVIDGVLDYAKLVAGAVVLDERVFRPRELAEEVIALFSALALRRGLELRCGSAGDADVLLLGDPVRLRQVLLNLVGNALKFTDEGTVDLRVTVLPVATDAVSAETASDLGRRRLHVEVRDTGVGMSLAAQGELFRPFVQAPQTTGTARGGTGLGLAISQQLVQAMGGHIGVRSTPGQGASFSFEIELPVAKAQGVAPPAPQVQAQGLQGRVLIVDDNSVNRIIARTMLERMQLEVSECEDGLQALRLLQEDPHDLVLMDCQMPVLDGFAATRRLRSGEAGAQAALLPVVALTAYAQAEDAVRCLEAGMNACLTKPYTQETLREALWPWLAAAEVQPRRDAALRQTAPP